MSDKTALIGLDWGTSSLRAWRIAADGAVLDERRRPWGILHLPDGGFPAAFAAVTEGWREGAPPLLACGMVGSRNGWVEAAYAPLPFDLTRFDAPFASVATGAGDALLVVPGLADPEGPDVMRGEETEAAGAYALLGRPAGPLTVVLPGTHSKWIRIEDGVVRGFATAMTGELHALLLRHSILAQNLGEACAPDAAAAAAAFAAGVRRGAERGALAGLFAARAATLLGRRDPGLLPEVVSGVLIGEELARMGGDGEIDALVGDEAVTQRYAQALLCLGRAAPRRIGSAAAHGLHLAACAHGLVDREKGETC